MSQAKEVISFTGLEVHFYLDQADTAGTSCMFKCVAYPGAKMGVPHFHESFDETVFGLKVVITYTVNGKTFDLGAGDPLFVKRGDVHRFMNNGMERAEFLCVINSDKFGPQYFRDISDVLHLPGPPDVPRLKEIMQQHGLVPVMA